MANMLDSQDPEKGHIPLAQIGSIQHLGVPTEEDKDLEIGEDGDEDSNHPGRASSADTIEPAPIETTQEMYRSKSQSSSQRSRPMSIIPRSKRRGFLEGLRSYLKWDGRMNMQIVQSGLLHLS